jgi:hypothetical protein
MDLIGATNRAKFKSVMRDAHDTFNKAVLVWKRSAPTTVSLYNEQEPVVYTDIDLNVLVGYNSFRTWPIVQQTNAGELDNQNMVVYINREYLGELGYLTSEGYFDFRPDQDVFIHMGIRYKCEGDTGLSQNQDLPLLVMLILRREETLEGTQRTNQS